MSQTLQIPNCFISIEGNIGVGKTSFLALLSEALQIPFELIPEPVSEWQNFKQTDSSKNTTTNILEMFYKDPKRWAYLFQTLCFGSRVKNLLSLKKKMQDDQNSKLFIFERSLESDREIFAKSFHLDGLFTEAEWLLYNEYLQFMTKEFCFPMTGVIYLRARSSVCLERIKRRKREEETGISYEYLEELDTRHEEWLRGRGNVLVIDAEENYLKDLKVRERVIGEIREWIANIMGRV